MPVLNITVSECIDGGLTEEQILCLRDIVAEGVTSVERRLDRDHVVARVIQGRRLHMLGEVELEVLCQRFDDRFAERDSRAERISAAAVARIGYDVATWIHLVDMGYSRVTADGERFFSD